MADTRSGSGGTRVPGLIPREEADRIIRAQDPEDLIRMAWREAYPNLAADIDGLAVLDLSTGEVTPEAVAEGHAEGFGDGRCLTLYECPAQLKASRSHPPVEELLSEGEVREVELRAREDGGGSATGDEDPLTAYGYARIYLQEKGERIEDREEDAFVRWALRERPVSGAVALARRLYDAYARPDHQDG